MNTKIVFATIPIVKDGERVFIESPITFDLQGQLTTDRIEEGSYIAFGDLLYQVKDIKEDYAMIEPVYSLEGTTYCNECETLIKGCYITHNHTILAAQDHECENCKIKKGQVLHQWISPYDVFEFMTID